MKIELQNIAASADGLYEYEGGKVLVFIPKKDIKKLSFGFEAPVRLPSFSVVFGVFLIAVGIIFGVVPLIKAIASNSSNLPILKGYALISLHILFGVYFAKSGLLKQSCLILDTKKGKRKLVFRGPVAGQKAEEFLNESARQFQYPI